MKYLLVIALCFMQLNAEDSSKKEEKQNVTIGLGPYVQTQPYSNVAPLLLVSPVIFFDNSLFYVRWSRFGMYFLGNKGEDISWGFSLSAQPRTFGYEPTDSDEVKGMDARKNSFEGGLAFSASYKDYYIETMALTDVFERYDSWILKTEVGAEYTLGDFSFYPSLIVTYQSDDFVNYYYGVRDTEATASRPKYNAKAGFQLGAQTYINYPLTDNMSAFVNLRADKIPSSAANSPIVNEEYIYSGLVSLIYTFEY